MKIELDISIEGAALLFDVNVVQAEPAELHTVRQMLKLPAVRSQMMERLDVAVWQKLFDRPC